MTLRIYNTLTQQKEIFKPIAEGKIGYYACGVTVYDHCHLGHARTYIMQDVVVRYLRSSGYEVKHVRNITDIDDKIIKRANENKEEISDLTERFIKEMNEDFAELGLLSPNHEPRATEFIPQMVSLIEKIIENKHAYVAKNGDVCFEVRSFEKYGCLSHHNIDDLESGARVEVTEVKRDPLDFVLWKLVKPGEPSWESPWGAGRPGWHIECSAMSMQLLGEQFDIHAGGRDLIFPHHENEIAQTEAVTKKNFVNTWMHGGFLQINKEKMSKSLGNFVTIRELLKDHDAEVLRYLLVASHYRSPLIYAEDIFEQSMNALTRFYTALRGLPKAVALPDSVFEEKFNAAMDDDFNTPIALAVLFDLSHEIQRLKEKELSLAAQHGALLQKLSSLLGIAQKDPEAFFQADLADVDPTEIDSLIAQRKQARTDKDWARADEIRKQLAEMNVVLEDAAGITTWRSAGSAAIFKTSIHDPTLEIQSTHKSQIKSKVARGGVRSKKLASKKSSVKKPGHSN